MQWDVYRAANAPLIAGHDELAVLLSFYFVLDAVLVPDFLWPKLVFEFLIKLHLRPIICCVKS